MYEKAKTLILNAKHSGLCSGTLLDDKLQILGVQEKELAVHCLTAPGQSAQDYLHLEIDMDTGVIKNWKKPTVEQLGDMFGAWP